MLDNFEIQSGAHPLSKIPPLFMIDLKKNCTVSIILEKSQEVVNKYFKLYDPNHFLEFIRQYNNAFAFASMSANIHQFTARGPYCFRIHGQIYHRAGNLHPSEGEQAKYGQIYVYIFLKVGKHLMCVCKTSTMFNVQRKPWHSFKEL